MTILGLAELFETINQPFPTITLFDILFIGKYKRLGREILAQSSVKPSICGIEIEKCR